MRATQARLGSLAASSLQVNLPALTLAFCACAPSRLVITADCCGFKCYGADTTVLTATQLFASARVSLPWALLASWQLQPGQARVDVTEREVTIRCSEGRVLFEVRLLVAFFPPTVLPFTPAEAVAAAAAGQDVALPG